MPGRHTDIYRLMIARLYGEKAGSARYKDKLRALVDKGIGGFIIFGGRRGEVGELAARLRDRAGGDIIMASDVEYGVGQQIQGYTRFPFEMAMAAAVDLENKADARMLDAALDAVASESLDAGINTPLIPVMDVNTNPDNPIICTRAFSDSPEVVSSFGSHYIKRLQERGLIACAKHFPGHGDTSQDSHMTLPVIKKTREELFREELAPFAAAVRAGVGSIMMGHLSVPSIDSLPATMSGAMITGVLRDELGFDGIVMTDALIMDALDGFDDVEARCVRAGADMLLYPKDPDRTAKRLAEAVKKGTLGEERIRESIKRIERTKGIFKRQGGAPSDSGNADISRFLFEMSITVVKSAPDIMPVDKNNSVVALIGDGKHDKRSPLAGFAAAVTKEGDVKGKTLVAAVFSSVSAWRGSSGISPAEIERASGLVKDAARSVVISFGSPYVLRHFRDADVLIAAYDKSVSAIEAAIGCLEGRFEPKGRLPVDIGI